MITLAEYQQQIVAGYTHIPLVQEVLADMDTPLSLYLKLANKPFTYLLESVVNGERFGRYSFIGLHCDTYLKISGTTTEVCHQSEVIEIHQGNPLAFIEEFQARYKTPSIPDLSRFTGGLVGYFGYEIIYHFEQIAHRLKYVDKPNPTGVPDIFLLLSLELAVVDNLSGKIYLIVYADSNKKDGYQQARIRLEELRTALRQCVQLPLSLGSELTEPVAETGEEQYKNYVKRVREYILNGDCMQVVPSQRLSMSFHDNPLSLYRALRTLNPSPYLFYYHFDDFYVVGSSPEILVQREQNTVTVRPIAGTRPRGETAKEDQLLAQELSNDPKEVAEHVMLIDLGRNDVGRVSKIGQVKLTEKMTIERYSHVMHLVSNIEGELLNGISNLDILAATFPAGTLSGAPKVRALEIIEELEPNKRGVYGGAVGYLSFSGDMDLCIAIRTGVIRNNTLYIQSGGGIVFDSDEELEWQETQNKAKAVIRAAHMVQQGLDR